jgi:hypothetical protein
MDLDGSLSTEVAIIKDRQDYYDIVTWGLALSNDGPNAEANQALFLPSAILFWDMRPLTAKPRNLIARSRSGTGPSPNLARQFRSITRKRSALRESKARLKGKTRGP